MSAASFEENSISWQIQQAVRNFQEWQELQSREIFKNPNLPSISWDWIDFSLLWQITKIFLVLLIVGLIIGAAWQMWQLLSPAFNRFGKQSTGGKQSKQEKELSTTDWLRRSQQFQRQGDYYQAFQCLYLAMLQQLSDRGIAPYQSSRTDGEYLQIVRRQSRFQAYQFLLLTHQRLCFGNQQASLNLLEECQQAYKEIEAS
jgi:hypothetical protein